MREAFLKECHVDKTSKNGQNIYIYILAVSHGQNTQLESFPPNGKVFSVLCLFLAGSSAAACGVSQPKWAFDLLVSLLVPKGQASCLPSRLPLNCYLSNKICKIWWFNRMIFVDEIFELQILTKFNSFITN